MAKKREKSQAEKIEDAFKIKKSTGKKIEDGFKRR